MAMVAGIWGFLTGHLLRRRLFPNGEQASLSQRLLRLPAGLVVLLALYLGLQRLLPAEAPAQAGATPTKKDISLPIEWL